MPDKALQPARLCLVFRFDSGKIKEVTNFCGDQHKADMFFHEVCKLKPIPGRLLGGAWQLNPADGLRVPPNTGDG